MFCDSLAVEYPIPIVACDVVNLTVMFIYYISGFFFLLVVIE